jgi:hypothetical protein
LLNISGNHAATCRQKLAADFPLLPKLLKVGPDCSNDVMLSVRVPVVDVDLEGSVVVAVAEISHLDLGRLPGGTQVVLDHLALVDNRELKRLSTVETIFEKYISYHFWQHLRTGPHTVKIKGRL